MWECFWAYHSAIALSSKLLWFLSGCLLAGLSITGFISYAIHGVTIASSLERTPCV
jgi:hypothetical protein